MLNPLKMTKNIYLLGLAIIALVVMALVPAFAAPYTIIFITSIIMYVILTVSWTLFSGATGYLSLATAAFFGIGIYTSAILGGDLPFAVVIIIGGLISLVLAALVGAITLRLRGVYFAIFTLGLVELIRHTLIWYEVKFTGTRGRFVVLVDNDTIYYAMLITFVVLLATMFIIKRSRWGLALQSISDHEEAASHIGINTTMLKISIFAISSFFIGAAGAIIATRWTYIDPPIAFNYVFSFIPVLMAVFGGMSNWYGPIVGAFIFSYLEELLLTKFPYHYMIIFGLMLLLAIMYLPNGITGLIQQGWRKLFGGKRAHT